MAKFCTGCGAQLDEAVKFCTGCGAKCPEAGQQAQHQLPLPPAPPPPPLVPAKRKSKAPLIIGGMAVLAVLIILIAVLGKGGGTEHGGGHTAQPTGVEAVATNALDGIWSARGYNDFYYWSFGEDGRFAYYVTSGQVPMNPSAGVNMAYASEAYFKGNYRVNGNTIEFYNCQNDSYFEYNGTLKYFKNRDFSGSILLDTPLQNSEKADDFSLTFEFKNASRLRIVIDRGGPRDNYDWLFDYVGTRSDVLIPSHSLPGSAWPKGELPPDLPEYNDGRIMSTSSSSQYYICIKIDGSTREVYIDYVERMAQSGWDWYSDSTKSEFEAFKRGEDFKMGCTLLKSGYSITVSYSTNEIGLVEIIWWK